MGFYGIYTLVICYIYGTYGPVEIVRFPSNSMIIFNSYVKLPESRPGQNIIEADRIFMETSNAGFTYNVVPRTFQTWGYKSNNIK